MSTEETQPALASFVSFHSREEKKMPLQLQSGILSASQVLEGIPGLGNILRLDTLNVQQRWKKQTLDLFIIQLGLSVNFDI